MDPREGAMPPSETSLSSADPASEPEMRVVTFRLLGERYALPIERVQEVIPCRDLASAFATPDDQVGVYRLRGETIPLVQLRRRLEASGVQEGRRMILVCRVGDWVIGYIVEGALRVVGIPPSSIAPPPSEIHAKAPRHVIGVAEQDGGPVTILDVVGVQASPTNRRDDDPQRPARRRHG
jgi:purine-binding chemotaxis protein CheW